MLMTVFPFCIMLMNVAFTDEELIKGTSTHYVLRKKQQA
jgi:hypothetical protein